MIKVFIKAFLRGMGSINIFPSRQQSYTERFGTDEECLASDWKKVGDDMRKAIKQ